MYSNWRVFYDNWRVLYGTWRVFGTQRGLYSTLRGMYSTCRVDPRAPKIEALQKISLMAAGRACRAPQPPYLGSAVQYSAVLQCSAVKQCS